MRLNPDLPPRLEEIINKSLEKDRSLRYQHASEIRADLQRLKRDTDSNRQSPTLSAAESISAASVAVPQPSSSSSAIVTAAKQHKWGLAASIVIALSLFGTAGVGVYSLLHRPPSIPFQNFTITKMTDTGNVQSAAISPDGKYLVHVIKDKSMSSLWMRHIATNSATQIIPPSPADYVGGLTFSPDGNYLYFVRVETEIKGVADVYRVPVLGGNPQQMAHDCDSEVTVSPDGNKIAFLRNLPATDLADLVTVSIEKGEERVLARMPWSDQRPEPAWSPDGKTIVVNSYSSDPSSSGDAFSTPLIAIDAITGLQHQLSESLSFAQSVWLPDGRGLFAILHPPRKASNNQIVFITYPEGRLFRLTDDTSTYSGISISNDQKLLATVVEEERGTLSVRSSTRADVAEVQVTSPVNEAWWYSSWTKDNALLIEQYPKLLILRPPAAEPTELTVSDAYAPTACGDGQHIVFWRDTGIWRADVSGGNLVQLAGKDNYGPVCSPVGNWVYYMKLGKEHETTIMKIPLEGGEPERLSKLHPDAMVRSNLSSDGKLLALFMYSSNTLKVAIISTESGETIRMVPIDKRFTGGVRFMPHSRSLAYVVRDDRGYGIWIQPFDGSAGKFLIQPGPDWIGSFQWSFDGKKLAVTRVHRERDVALIRSVN